MPNKNWPTLPQFEECGCCGHWHATTFSGDCRSDPDRFSTSDIEDHYGDGMDSVLLFEIEPEA